VKRLLLFVLFVACGYCPAGAPNTGSTTCPASGNKAVLSKSAPTGFFVLLSLVSNTGSDIEVGNASVTTSTGLQLLPGQSLAPGTQGNTALYDLGNTYFACQNTTDVVRWLYY
jgi:hypothetical protein